MAASMRVLRAASITRRGRLLVRVFVIALVIHRAEDATHAGARQGLSGARIEEGRIVQLSRQTVPRSRSARRKAERTKGSLMRWERRCGRMDAASRMVPC